jgi:hypothetical protein
VVSALAGAVPGAPVLDELRTAAPAAAGALERLRHVLLEMRPGLPRWHPVGRDAFDAFLRDVACIPMDADALMAIGVREYQRASVLERLEAHRHRDRPAPDLPPDVASQVAGHAGDEIAVRAFLEAEGLLSQPATLRHYLNVPIPAYLTPLSFLGVTDDLTSLADPDGDATSYIPDPAPGLPYFGAANAADPRAGIVHEGAHAQQFALSWKHPRPVRRRYHDSGSNEGIAFYNEEMTLAAGLFEDAPHTRGVIYNFMRLRVFLADAAIARPELTLRELHDSLWLNGNVPIALQRWELLGLTDELDAIGLGRAG